MQLSLMVPKRSRQIFLAVPALVTLLDVLSPRAAFSAEKPLVLEDINDWPHHQVRGKVTNGQSDPAKKEHPPVPGTKVAMRRDDNL